ncbi:transcription termination/antitermination protein NusG [Seohaeicola saemankumensis]|uniref:Transcription termination/antitermination protein NusG n=2 Tax=Seohaeicola saemankumensis TaxID=481181 RepID=A0ABW3TDK1_9RHOB
MSYGAREFAAEQWHLLLCKPNQNQIAFRNLTRLGFDVFMPRHKTERRWKGRLRQQLHPVFGGYIFLSKGASGQELHLAKTAPGVSTLVGFGSVGPAVVPAGIVAGLMSRCDHEGLLTPQVDAFDVGDQIRIVSGPFADFVTSVEKIDPDRRLHVLLELLGRQTRVQVDPEIAVRRL